MISELNRRTSESAARIGAAGCYLAVKQDLIARICVFSCGLRVKCALDRTVLRVFVLLGRKNGLDRTDLCFFVRSGGWWLGYIRREDVSDGRKDYTFGLISGQFGFRAQIQACFWTAFEWFCVREKKTASISCASDHARPIMRVRSCASDHVRQIMRIQGRFVGG